jgi:hypothetical protein
MGAGVLLASVLALPVVFGTLRPTALPALTLLPLAALAGLLGLDLMVGTPLLREAWVSYSVMEGARYYGIGNEYCGALLVAGLGAAVLLRHMPVWIWSTLLAALALLVVWPGGGANAGGFLGLAVGFGTAMMVWFRGKPRMRDIGILLIVIAVGTVAALVWDMSRSVGDQSHIARAIGGGPLQIALRKLELNAWLLTHSPWTLLLLAAGVALIIGWREADSSLRCTVVEDRRSAGALIGMLAGSAALLLLNDSGVVAAAESLGMAWAAAVSMKQSQSA